MQQVAEVKYGANDALARLVYFKIVRFGRTAAAAAAATSTAAKSATSAADGLHRRGDGSHSAVAGGTGGDGGTPTSESALVRAAFERYRADGGGGGVSLPAFVRLCADAGLVPNALTPAQVATTAAASPTRSHGSRWDHLKLRSQAVPLTAGSERGGGLTQHTANVGRNFQAA